MTAVTAVAVGALLAGCGRYDFAPLTDAERTTYREAVLADHPVAYWRLGDAGGSAREEIGGDDGTYQGNCGLGVAGALVADPDAAVSFDGTCQIQLSDQQNFSANAPFSIEVWVFGASPAGFYHYFTRETRSGLAPVDGYALIHQASGVYMERVVNTTNHYSDVVPIPADSFTHVVGIYDGQSQTLYINGVASTAASDASALNTFTVGALIGAHPQGAHFAGVMDEVAIYDHVLAADRIGVHYQIGTQGPL